MKERGRGDSLEWALIGNSQASMLSIGQLVGDGEREAHVSSVPCVCSAGVGYLGGGDKVDLNNANVRAYVKYPGLYPTIAGKIVSHGPYKNVGDVFSASGLTGTSDPPIPPSSLQPPPYPHSILNHPHPMRCSDSFV